MLINGELLINWNHVIISLCIIVIVIIFSNEISNLKKEQEQANTRIIILEKRVLIIGDFANKMKKLIVED